MPEIRTRIDECLTLVKNHRLIGMASRMAALEAHLREIRKIALTSAADEPE